VKINTKIKINTEEPEKEEPEEADDSNASCSAFCLRILWAQFAEFCGGAAPIPTLLKPNPSSKSAMNFRAAVSRT
jgi:hypothetical protein